MIFKTPAYNDWNDLKQLKIFLSRCSKAVSNIDEKKKKIGSEAIIS